MHAINKGRLKIGLLVNSRHVDAYTHGLVAWAVAQPHLEVSHCLVLKRVDTQSAQTRWSRITSEISSRGLLSTLSRRLHGRLFRFLWAKEARSLRRVNLHPEFFEQRDLGELVPATLDLGTQVSPSGYVYRVNDESLERIRELEFDVLLRFCDGILKGGILSSASQGILSFHHGDNRINRGGPPGFWEVYQRRPETGFIIQRLSEELDGGEVVFRGSVQTQRGWLLNQAHLYQISYYYLRGVLDRLAAAGSVGPCERNTPYYAPLYRTPGTWQILRYLATRYLTSLISAVEQRRHRRPRWGVAFCSGGWRSAVLHRGSVIPAPPGHFIADPFLIRRNERDYVFVEDLDFATMRGIITVYELKDGQALPLGTALEEDFHLSFPWLFEYDSELYMCPETCEARDVRLYRCVDFPLRWEKVQTVFAPIDTTDTMIFEKDGLWWLFTNEDSARAGDYCYQLSIYYAADPLAGNWTPHPQNPIYVDAQLARNGGLLREDGELYRVNQEQGFGIYGRAAGINHIVELSPRAYREERVSRIEPQFLPGIFATHHMHANDRYTVFDFCRMEKP